MKSIVFVCLLLLAYNASAYNFTGQLTVSGLSAGAFMAVQYHVAFSSEVSGCAVFAGGPYYCAQDTLESALTACTSFPEALDVSTLISAAQSFAGSGDIDALIGLKNDRVFLYSGTGDTVVKQKVVEGAQTFYVNFGCNVTTEFNYDSEHCQPTLDYGNDCTHLGSPYINKCGYDGAGVALQALYGKALNPRGTAVSGNLLQVNQKKYMPDPVFGVTGLADTAYVYVPTACQGGAKCSIHVNFHGCNQDLATIGTVYVEHAGFLEWAESNNIITLFPQAAAADLHENPEACFDWWGYVNKDYAFKTSKQMRTFRSMIQALASKNGITLAN